MHFLYTLLASGLLILTDVPAELFLPQLSNPNLVQQTITAVERELHYQPNSYVAVEWLQDSPEEQLAETAPGSTPTPTPTVHSTPVPSGATTAVNHHYSSLPISGYAMYYNPNVMQEVLSNRIRMGHVSVCAECVGQVALLRPGDLNRRVWLQWSDGVVEGPFLVADVAATHHVAQLVARNWVVDVDYRTAIRRKMAGPVPVTVWGAPPTDSVQPMDAGVRLQIEEQSAPAVQTPTPTLTPYALNATPTVTPLPEVVAAPVANGQQAAFPTDTPIPTITPLPAIN